jgi:FtsP/CotA-like multicopper oxidase with cupredoxin domain
MRRLVLLALLLAGCRAPAPEVSRRGRAISPAEAPDLDPAPGQARFRLTAAARPDAAPYLYAYEGQNPGPTLRVQRGDVVTVELVNQLPDPTTIHWHGLHVPFEMDGVAWMRAPVGPGETFTYTFTVSQVGTFWYHPHFNTHQQVEGGLYGALIVEAPTEPRADQDVVLIFDAEAEARAGDPVHGHGALRTAWRVNGQRRPTLAVVGGQVVRARLLNAASAGYLALRAPQLRVIAHDQGLLSAPEDPALLVLSPGDRAEVEWRIGADGFTLETLPYSLNGGLAYGDPIPLLDVAVSAPGPAPGGLAWAFDGATPTPDPGAPDLVYAFAGSDRTGVWMINGERFPNVTVHSIPLGAPRIIEVRNLSPSEHPFHPHGMSFEVLSVNGRPPAARQVEDTLNLAIRDVVRLRVVPEVPGDWMTHCHILPHAEDGMMTVLRVTP